MAPRNSASLPSPSVPCKGWAHGSGVSDAGLRGTVRAAQQQSLPIVITSHRQGRLSCPSYHGEPVSGASGLAFSGIPCSSPPCAVGLNTMAGEADWDAGGRDPSPGLPEPGLPGSGMLGEAGGENSFTADTGHSLVQLTQGVATSPRSAPHPAPHRASTASLTRDRGWTRWHRDGGRVGAGRLGG